jgi:hypothetical protein
MKPSASTTVPRATSLPSTAMRTVLWLGFATTSLKTCTILGFVRKWSLLIVGWAETVRGATTRMRSELVQRRMRDIGADLPWKFRMRWER